MASPTTLKASFALECEPPIILYFLYFILTGIRYIIIALAFYVYPDDAGDIGKNLFHGVKGMFTQ